MKTAQDIIIAPVITEKSMSGIADKKYTFKVAKDANKIEIADAVAKLFKVDVANQRSRSGKTYGPLQRLHCSLEKGNRYFKG